MSDQGRFFSNHQRSVIAAAASMLSFVVILVLGFVLFGWVKDFLYFFKDVIWPIAVAGILALMLRPVIALLTEKLSMSRLWAIIVTFAFFSICFIGLGAFIIPKAFDQTSRFIQALPEITANIQNFLKTRVPFIYEYTKDYLNNLNWETLQSSLLGSGGDIAQVGSEVWQRSISTILSIITTATLIAVIPIYLFYLLDSNHDYGKTLKKNLSFIPQNIRDDVVFLGTEFSNIVVAFFRGQLLIGLIMGVLMAIGFSAFGLQFGLLLGLMLGLANVVPYLGAILSLITVLPLAYLQPEGGLPLFASCVGVLLVVQLIEGYLLTPKIMGKQTGLHPMVIMISIFFWGTALNGLLGMVLAIPLTATFVIGWRLVQNKYIPIWNNLSSQSE